MLFNLTIIINLQSVVDSSEILYTMHVLDLTQDAFNFSIGCGYEGTTLCDCITTENMKLHPQLLWDWSMLK